MNRRGLVGLLGLAAGSGGLVGGQVGMAPPAFTAPVGFSGGPRTELEQEEYRLLTDLFYERKKQRQRQHMRQREAVQLCGGLHPHVHGVKSWAPWFVAAVSVRKMQEMEEAYDGWYEKLKKEVMGKWWNW